MKYLLRLPVAHALKRRPYSTVRIRTPTPSNPLVILGIETSCDDTSASIVTSNRDIKSLVTIHQTPIHEKTGGIIPAIASLHHSRNLPKVISKAIDDAGITVEQIDAVAATRGPGLASCLGVGLNAGKVLASVLKKPVIGVHHMEAHLLTPLLTSPIPPSFPFLTLLLSGGHTLLVLSHSINHHQVLGTTLDDSIGEAYDKVARWLGLKWLNQGGGAGAALEIAARRAQERAHEPNQKRIQFTVPLREGRNRDNQRMNFSFSGLKTSVKNYIDRCDILHLSQFPQSKATINASSTSSPHVTDIDPDSVRMREELIFEIAYAFQEAAITHLMDRFKVAVEYCQRNVKEGIVKDVVVSGGVASNQAIRNRLTTFTTTQNLNLHIPPANLCTDNAAMIAWTGLERLRLGLVDEADIDYIPKWGLEDLGKVPEEEWKARVERR